MHGAPLALGLGVVVAGGLVAALAVTHRGHEADSALAATREAAVVAGDAGDRVALPPVYATGDPTLAAALTRMADALDRIEKTLARLEGREGSTATEPSDARDAEPAASGASGEPWYRRTGAVIEWMPPDGVSLVRAWYRLRIGNELIELARDDPAPEATVAARESWIREIAPAEGWKKALDWGRRGVDGDTRAGELAVRRLMLARLDEVESEIELARWLHETGSEPPQRWQLAEFAAARAGK